LHVVYADHVLVDSELSGFARAETEKTRDEQAASVAEAAAAITAAAGVPHTLERRQEAPADAILDAARVHGAAEPGSAPIIVTGRSHHVAHRSSAQSQSGCCISRPPGTYHRMMAR
jgi:nucleotide-binding universal stress UspA family protein